MPDPRSQDGSITAETAVVLPVLVLVLVALMGVAHAVGVQLTAEDAARVGARAAARGESQGEVERLTRSVAPAGSVVTVSRSGGLVRVEVVVQVISFGASARLVPELTVDAHAVAADESTIAVGGVP